MSFRMWVGGMALGATLLGQQTDQQVSTWTIDSNGQRVEGPTYTIGESPTLNQQVERTQSINGRMVPVQSSEDRVLRQDSQGKVVERLIRKYDANGNLGVATKVLIEEKKNPDGSTSIQSSAYESDINGNMRLYERSTTQVRKSAVTESSTTVERATLNGSLQAVERNVTVERPAGSGSQIESTAYRRDVSGNFSPYVQEVTQVAKNGDEETKDAAHYELDVNGKLSLASRAVDHVRTNPDGSQVVDTDVYSKFSVGHAADVNADQPRLQQQVHRERMPGTGGVVVENISVRARLPNDPSRFGAFQRTSQVTYTSTDANGNQVKKPSIVVSRRDTNGQIVVDEGRVEQSVTTKK